MSKIEINRDVVMPKIKERFGKRGNAHPDQSVDLADHTLYFAQKWFDEQPWLSNPELDTPRELRISLMRYIKRNIDLRDHRRSYFVPSFVWVFIAQQVIGWVVKWLIDNYFDEIAKDFPEDKT